MSIRPLALALPALALLAACAQEPAPAPVVAQAPVAQPAPPPPVTGFDGRYGGTLSRARNSARTCRPVSAPAQAVVQNGEVRLTVGRNTAPLMGTVNAAGEAALASDAMTAAVKAAPATLSGMAMAGECHYTLALRKRRG